MLSDALLKTRFPSVATPQCTRQHSRAEVTHLAICFETMRLGQGGELRAFESVECCWVGEDEELWWWG